MAGWDSCLEGDSLLKAEEEPVLQSQAKPCGAHPGPWLSTHRHRVTQRCHHLDVCWSELMD